MDIIPFNLFSMNESKTFGGFQTFPAGVDPFSRKGVVKFGVDPTSDKLHLGHLIPIRMVKKLKENGCDVHIILGTFTAQMGDPSGKDTMRPILTGSQTGSNADSILSQIKRILGNDITVHRNHEWFDKMTLPKMMNILSKYNVTQLLSRDSFQKRMESGNPIGMHELVVPILQGIDSVELKAAIEVGGSDQLFNFVISRELQELMGQEPEICVMSPIINGTDGRKMSKSYNNCIYINDTPQDVFGKAMSVSDEVMMQWYPIFFDSWEKKHPMEMKKDLASTITDEIWGEGKGVEERAKWESQFQKKVIPDDIPVIDASILIDFVVALKKDSRSNAKRLIDAGAVSINGEKASNMNSPLNSGDVVKVGRRDLGKVK